MRKPYALMRSGFESRANVFLKSLELVNVLQGDDMLNKESLKKTDDKGKCSKKETP